MRLSDIKGERVLDVIADLIEPVCNIAEDEEAAAFFRPQKLAEGQTPQQLFLKRVKASVPKLIRDHREDLVSILATLKGVDKKEYAEAMTMPSVVADVVELMSDEEFLAFLS